MAVMRLVVPELIDLKAPQMNARSMSIISANPTMRPAEASSASPLPCASGTMSLLSTQIIALPRIPVPGPGAV
jgi:hypothetical protein